MQCFPSPGGNRVLTRVSVSYLWCNVSPFLVVTVSLLVLLSYLWCNVSPLLVVTVSLLVLLSLISGAMFPLSWW